MSENLGFSPTEKGSYFFLSYNSEDADRIAPIAARLSHCSVPIWYDNGIPYDEKWESIISSKINDTQAVLLFFTKGILKKENSYVKKEYVMATKYLKKKVYVIFIDKIEEDEIPLAHLSWWIDIQEKQCMQVADKDTSILVDTILKGIGYGSNQEKMNTLFSSYQQLYLEGKTELAEQYLAEYLHEQSISEKAAIFNDIKQGKIPGIKLLEDGLEEVYSVGEEHYQKAKVLSLDNITFAFGIKFVFHYGCGDANVFDVMKDGKTISGIGHLMEACDLHIYYDKGNDEIFVLFSSIDVEEYDKNRTESWINHVLVIENAKTDAVCHTFVF